MMDALIEMAGSKVFPVWVSLMHPGTAIGCAALLNAEECDATDDAMKRCGLVTKKLNRVGRLSLMNILQKRRLT
ncbi:MAG TPA: hypothetical protein VM884_05330 [Flavisolibacter sp.]|jgi:hypothetical protein|nr:hypothetical protein [Flavisolibacter sp.]